MNRDSLQLKRRWTILGIFAALICCNPDFSQNEIETLSILARVSGKIVSTEGLGERPIRLALIWKTKEGNAPFAVSDDIEVSGEGDLRHYTLELKQMPPTHTLFARQDVPEVIRKHVKTQSSSVAVGTLVVYDDKNGNQSLDRNDTGSQSENDLILGINQTLAILYVEKEGVSIFQSDTFCFPELFCEKGSWLKPKSSRFMRRTFQGEVFTITIDKDLINETCIASESLTTYGRCERWRYQIENRIDKECYDFEKKTCPGNPEKNKPSNMFQPKHEEILNTLKKDNCCSASLGEAPWTCNPGILDCPEGYTCCDNICQKECKTKQINKLAKIPGGTFTMGSPEDEPCRGDSIEEKQHKVTLTHDFELSTTEVTQAQFQVVMGYLPPKEGHLNYVDEDDPRLPVHNITWHQAVAYCNTLSTLNDLETCYDCTGDRDKVECTEKSYRNQAFYDCPGYRLPTEAEWEYAYRAGTQTAFYNGKINSCDDRDSKADEIGWYKFNTDPKQIYPAGQKTPNSWGLYDMAGNVAEWVQDWYIRDHAKGRTLIIDPYDSQIHNWKVYRGGSKANPPRFLRASSRTKHHPTTRNVMRGFRCVRTNK